MIYTMVDLLGKTSLAGSYDNPNYLVVLIILTAGCIFTGAYPLIHSGKSEFSLNRVFLLSLFFLWPGRVAFAAVILSMVVTSLLRRAAGEGGIGYSVVSGVSIGAILLAGSILSPAMLPEMPSPLVTVFLIPAMIATDIIISSLFRLTGKRRSGFLDSTGRHLLFYIAVLPLSLITVVLVQQVDIAGSIIAAVGISGFSFIGRSIEKNHQFNQTRIRAISYQDRLATELMRSSSYSEFVGILEHHFFDSHSSRIRMLSRSSGMYDWTLWNNSGQTGISSSEMKSEIPKRGELSAEFTAGEMDWMAVGLSEACDLALLIEGKAEVIFTEMPGHLRDNLVLLLRHTWEAVGHSMRSERSFLAAAVMLARLADSKDDYTHGHSIRVSNMATALGRNLGLSSESIRTLRVGGILHDIGKLAIPNEILTKRGLLTKSERRIIQDHPVEGARIVSELSGYETVTKIIRSHHERLDGSGYPDGLTGINIPFLARIVAVADTFDAITSARSYHSIAGWDNAMETIREGSGIHFDSRVVDALEMIVRKGAVNWA